MRGAAAAAAIATLAVGVAACGPSDRTAAPSRTRPAPTTVTTLATGPPATTLGITATNQAPPVSGPVPSGPPPAGFGVVSVTFVSAIHGWVLGYGPYPSGTRVEETTDGGGHWRLLAAVLPGNPTDIRFADATYGYAYSQDTLDVTSDGGRTWRQVAIPDEDRGDGTGAQALEIADGRTWLLNAAVPYPSIYEAPVGSTSFRRVGQSANRLDQLSVQGPEAYVLGPSGAGPVPPTLVVATTAGVSNRTVPCYSTATRDGDAGALTPLVTPGRLVIACVSKSPSISTSTFYRSTDGGRTWSRLGSTPCQVTSLTRTSTAVFGACGYAIVRQPLSGGPSSMVFRDDSGLSGFTFVGFTNDADGVAIDIPPGGNYGALYVTRDGGGHWRKAVAPTAG